MKRNYSKVYFKTNEQIRAPELRVLDREGKQIGVLSRDEALALAKKEEKDLIEIAPQAKPPVVKLMEFSKFLYQHKKKTKEERKKNAGAQTKQLRFGPFIDDHDLGVRIRRAKEFFERGDKVKFIVRYKGRQMARQDAGYLVMNKIVELLDGVGKVEREPRMEGRQLTMLMARNTGKKAESEEIQKAEETKPAKLATPPSN